MEYGWTLTPAAFEGLLSFLASDRDQAAVAYGELRHRIVSLHRWWGAADPEHLADLTLDRAARKLQEGAPVERDDFGAYVRGVARMVSFEAARQPAPVGLDRDPVVTETASREAAFSALDDCLASLSAEDRGLVLRYYEGVNQIETRRRLAEDLSMTPPALRLRAHRIRLRLEGCVSARLRQP